MFEKPPIAVPALQRFPKLVRTVRRAVSSLTIGCSMMSMKVKESEGAVGLARRIVRSWPKRKSRWGASRGMDSCQGCAFGSVPARTRYVVREPTTCVTIRCQSVESEKNWVGGPGIACAARRGVGADTPTQMAARQRQVFSMSRGGSLLRPCNVRVEQQLAINRRGEAAFRQTRQLAAPTQG